MHGAKPRTEQQISQSIIAWLCALAVMCERAAFAVAPVRFAVLWMLRAGEITMRDYAQGLAEDFGYLLDLPAPEQSWYNSSPDDALALAYQFRVLAVVLEALFAWIDTMGVASEGRVVRLVVSQRTQALAARISSLLQVLASVRPSSCPAPDTS